MGQGGFPPHPGSGMGMRGPGPPGHVPGGGYAPQMPPQMPPHMGMHPMHPGHGGHGGHGMGGPQGMPLSMQPTAPFSLKGYPPQHNPPPPQYPRAPSPISQVPPPPGPGPEGGRKKKGKRGQGGGNQQESGAEPAPAVTQFLQATSQGPVSIRSWARHLLLLAKDPAASKTFALMLKEASDLDFHFALQELHSQFVELSLDENGKDCIMAMVENASKNPQAGARVTERLASESLRLSLDVYGCRVMQAAIAALPPECQRMLVAPLRGHVLQCAESQHANHVLQRAVEKMNPKHVDFFVHELQDHAVRMAKHSFGCRILQRFLEKGPISSISKIVDDIVENHATLAKDQYGNYVVQQILKYGRTQDITAIFATLVRDISDYGSHKFASNVVEKCFAKMIVLPEAPDYATAAIVIVPDPTKETPLDILSNSKYGNFVLVRALETCSPPKRRELRERLRLQPPEVQRNYSKQLMSAIEKD